MSDAVLEVRVGARIWFDGAAWTVCAVNASTVRLHSGVGHYRLASIDDLLGSGSTIEPVGAAEAEVLPSVMLASLTSKQRAAVEREAAVLTELLVADDVSMAERAEAAARTLGVSSRTVRRRLSRFKELGPAGLVDERLTRTTRRSVDPRWDAACLEVLKEYATQSTPSKQTVMRRATKAFLAAVPDGKPPSESVAYERLVELDHGRYTFDDAKQRRSVAKRPQGVLGQLRPTRPGEYILLDGYKLDVFAMEPVTMRWVNTELTVAMDLFDRSIKGIRLRPFAARSADVANVLFQTMTPQRWGRTRTAPTGPYSGVPEHVVLGTVGVLPDTIVIDHGKVYMSEHTMGVCRRLGISVQPAIPYKPTDKPALERFFKTLRLSLLDKLPGYKGPDIASRGKDVEKGAFYYVSELEELIREWVGDVYHCSPHQGLCDPHLPRVDLSPGEMFNRGIEIAGVLRLPQSQDLLFDLLDVEWRTINHYGVEIDGRRYDGPAINPYRGRRSNYGGAHAGKWPFMVDVDDVRTVYFQDPTDKSWHELEWRLAGGLHAPFSRDAAEYTKRVSVQENRHIDPEQAIENLLARWSREEVLGRRERNLAIRLATQQAVAAEGSEDAADLASVPGVVDLLARRSAQQPKHRDHPDDLDVFERYFEENPDEDVLAVLDQ